MKTRRFNRSIPENVSKTHKEFYDLLIKLNPSHVIYCEYPCYKVLDLYCKTNRIDKDQEDIKLIRKKISNLSFDIYDSTMKVAFEIQGSQHKEFNEFFHQDLGGLDRQKSNDRLKKILCNLTELKLIEVDVNQELNEEYILNLYSR